MKKRALVLVGILFLSLLLVAPANAATPYVPIHDIQYTTDPSGDSPYAGQTVITRGVVTAVDGTKSFFIQNGTGPWNGVYVYLADYSMPNDLTIGSYVEVKGYVKEYYGLTELSVDKDYGNYVSVLGTAPVPDPEVLLTGEVSREQWESVLVKVENVVVTKEANKYGEWYVDDGSGSLMVDDLIYGYYPSKGQKLDYIIGVLYYSFGNFKLEPRNAGDIKEYIPSIKINEIDTPTYAHPNEDVTIVVKTENNGGFGENVTLLLSINKKLVLNTTVELAAGEAKNITYIWKPTKTGVYEIKAELGDYDTKYSTIKVVERPMDIMNRLTAFYDIRYVTYLKPQLDEKYSSYLEIISELKEYGVDLGPLEDKIGAIDTNIPLIEGYYSEYLELKGRYIRPLYPYPLMSYIRNAFLLTRETINRINEIMPILNETLIRAKESPENQTQISLVRVLVDSSHGQYYNDQRLQTLITKMEDELGWMVDVNNEKLTPETLSYYNVLIITNPKSDITDEEAQAIKEWVENGGGLLITGDWYAFVYYRSLNKVTEEFGIRFNDDELMDDERNTGRPYFPLVGEFNLNHPAMKFLNESSQLYYNGDTLDVSGNAVWLIRGYETSYAEGENNEISKEKGSKPIVAAAVEVGNGRIVAYGSSKAISDDYYGRYIDSNWPFLKGVLLWLAGEI